GPIYYFVLAFIAGFLPWTVAFARALAPLASAARGWRERARAHADTLFFALWFFVILIFFSLSHSKLLPYILPAFPAAAVLTARAILSAREHFRTPLLVHAVLATVIVAGGLGAGLYTGQLAHYEITALAALGGALLLAGSWLAVWQARRAGARAFFPAALGWAGVYLALVLMMPNLSEDLSSHALAQTAGAQAAAAGGARVVAYHCYPQTFPWELRRPIVVADYVDELGSDGVRPDSLFWSRSDFWRRWNAGERMIVVTKRRTLRDFPSTSIAPTMLASNRTYVLVTNASPAGTRPLATP
ncbi:MAG TPA: hypothetical protein VFS05_01070, partial [Gemmatimonadaceae bacterium]|nr:hypothetical protein [Gemmatimonadaceae bacterium]